MSSAFYSEDSSKKSAIYPKLAEQSHRTLFEALCTNLQE